MKTLSVADRVRQLSLAAKQSESGIATDLRLLADQIEALPSEFKNSITEVVDHYKDRLKFKNIAASYPLPTLATAFLGGSVLSGLFFSRSSTPLKAAVGIGLGANPLLKTIGTTAAQIVLAEVVSYLSNKYGDNSSADSDTAFRPDRKRVA